MGKKYFFLIACLFCFIHSSCKHGIKLIGVDHKGNIKAIKVHKEEYRTVLGHYLNITHKYSLKALDDVEAKEKESQESQESQEKEGHAKSRKKKYRVSNVTVGLGIQGQIGIADIVTLGVNPRMRLHFTRKK